MRHRTQSDLEAASFTTSGRMINAPEGYVFGWGTTVGGGLEGWAPGAMYIDTDAAADNHLWLNEGTSSSASWVVVPTP